MVTLVTVGTTTEIVAMPDLVGSITEVALIYKVDKVSLAATVSTPLELMLVHWVTEPEPVEFEPTVHVTKLSGLLLPITCA